MSILSVVVVVHNIPREAPRTLLSLSAGYQRHIEADDYEVVVVDNGSDPPFDVAIFRELRGNFRLLRIDPAPPSPAYAINRGLREARGDLIGVMVDGARLATPGLLHFARVGASLYKRAIVASMGWYLGHDLQRDAIAAGYSQIEEDALLRSIDWPRDGYRLFDIATLDDSSVDGWFSMINESNALFLSREFWELIGGVDEAFDMPGGGLLNLDTLHRAIEVPESELVLLLGEGTFHQVHGGIATNASVEQLSDRLGQWFHQYAAIRGRWWQSGSKVPTYIGTLPRQVLLRLARAAVLPIKPVPPLGPAFDRDLWSLEPPVRPADMVAAALVDIAHEEMRAGRHESTAAVARLARQHFPGESEPRRLLSLVGPALVNPVPETPNAAVHVALGRAYKELGDAQRARAQFEAALSIEPDLSFARLGLAMLKMPGPIYTEWLSRFHRWLSPKFYLEIGVEDGFSIYHALPPTCAIGVDPFPKIKTAFRTETHIFAETSDEFFDRGRLDGFLGREPLAFAFIDGEHSFEQSLLDFIHVERFCGPQSLVLLHDTCPLDEVTQDRIQRTNFWTGDVWKTVLCLKHFRPDLDIFTIATAWTGLTVVTGLDRTSRLLGENYQKVVEEFRHLPYAAVRDDENAALNLVPNDVDIVLERLRRRLNLSAGAC